MELFLNCEHPATIEEYCDRYVLAGVTTNPYMIAQEGGVNYFQYLRDLRRIIGDRKLNVQVVSPDCSEMIEEAELIRRAGGEPTYVKLPATVEGLRATKILSARGVKVTSTVVFSTAQGVLALLAGAKYVATFYEPMITDGTDGFAVIRQIAAFIERSGCEGRILSAGCRTSEHLGGIIDAGATAVTVDPDFFTDKIDYPGVHTYMNKFKTAWDAAYGKDATILDLAAREK